jgi:hypothetical protein
MSDEIFAGCFSWFMLLLMTLLAYIDEKWGLYE